MRDQIGRATTMGLHVAAVMWIVACQPSPGETCGDGYCASGLHCALASLDGKLPQPTCVVPNVCGNGVREEAIGEACDDGNLTDGDGCSHDCRSNETCGNGIMDPGEVCDDGNTLDHDGCSHDCTSLERCGDGVVDLGEECDGADVGGLHCSATCHLERCGNGIVDPGEQCDDGPGNNTDDKDCTEACKVNICGDGKPDLQGTHHEECDDGNRIDSDACTNQCTRPVCGDGVLEDGEQCDDHNQLDNDGCSHDCQFEFCGNGIVDNDPAHGIAEQCDHGDDPNADDHNADDHDCTAACQINVCGDGRKDANGPDHIEDCDDGAANTDNPACPYNTTCTVCNTQCHELTVAHVCGDGVVDVPEEVCDDHNEDACGSCSATCDAVTSQRAFGFILAVPGAKLVDGETFTLDDGVNPPMTFEFDTGDGVADGNVLVALTAQLTAAEVRQAIETAILAQHDAHMLLIAPTPDPSNTNDALVLLRHDRPATLGNHAITANVADPAFSVAGMFGGQGGNCDDGTGCSSNADCTSNVCNAQHVCETPPPPGGSAPLPATRTTAAR